MNQRAARAELPRLGRFGRGIALRQCGRQPKWQAMMVRLARLLLAVIFTLALAGMPAVDAAVAVSCDTTHAATVDNQPSSGHAPASAPCKTMMPGCVSASSCVPSALLHVHADRQAAPALGQRIALWACHDARAGVSIEPALNPPITL